MDVDDGAPDAGSVKPIEDVVDQGLARDAHEGLRQLGGERLHPGAEAGGEDHRRVGDCA
jgi:hypothetical protein